MNLWLAVFVGGGLGSLARFATGRLVLRMAPAAAFPWATLAANLLATALLAWAVLRFQSLAPERSQWHALLAVGFCGGFSTMSTFNHENYALLRDGLTGMALLNIVVSVGAGILLFHLFARSA
jgi:CrcB protein